MTTTTCKDPICGMNVEKAKALHLEREGKTYYFCGEGCLNKFKALPAGKLPDTKAGGCCG